MRVLTALASKYVAGDVIEDAMSAVAVLNERGIKATLDNLGEDSATRELAAAAVEENILMLRRIAEAKADANISLKLTQLGLAIDEGLCRDNLVRVAAEAEKLGNFVRIDMEGTRWTQKTLDIFYAVFGRYQNVGIVLQAMLRRTADDCREAVKRSVRVRLCKGAYKEPAALAFPAKDEVNAHYDLCAGILSRAPRPAFATHDDARISAAAAACSAAGVARGDYELQMLYGLRSERWSQLRSEGHAVRIYVPYGTHWLPYFYRRIRERKENAFFILKHLFS